MNWRKYVPIVLISAFYVVSLLSVWKLAQQDGYINGLKVGVDMYHAMCYTSYPPTFMIADDGTVVMCSPLTQVPQEELKNINPGT